MRVAGGGSSSERPDESLRNVWRRIELFGGGGIETAVEAVGCEWASPVGVLARGIV
jgi:heptaprenylglyceryl phosphate synthase